jgi:hypothetical protein
MREEVYITSGRIMVRGQMSAIVLRRSIAPAHSHAAEADGRDLEALSAELASGDHVPSFFSNSAFARFTADIAFGRPT